MNLFKVNGKFDLKKLIVSFLVTFVTALIGTIASIGAKEYYSTLNQPAFAQLVAGSNPARPTTNAVGSVEVVCSIQRSIG